ncbi:MAG: DUF4783 domain-containing protein, partial [Bacteroidia bacterium]|nr:DUF4783 domain-containing protein [Bacteroidia bacterium]
LVMIALAVYAFGDIYTTVGNAIKKGDAKALSAHFSSKVDLTILNKEDVYSKSQAEQILVAFFNKNKPSDFKIMHKGVSKEGAKYAIGNLKTTNGLTFRTYFFIKSHMGSEIVHELRFEKE